MHQTLFKKNTVKPFRLMSIELPNFVPPNAKFWTLDFYRQFYDVDTVDVVHRLLISLFPFRAQPFLDHLRGGAFHSEARGATTTSDGAAFPSRDIGERFESRSRSDLYGPAWIVTTLWILIAVASSISEILYTNSLAPDPPSPVPLIPVDPTPSLPGPIVPTPANPYTPPPSPLPVPAPTSPQPVPAPSAPPTVVPNLVVSIRERVAEVSAALPPSVEAAVQASLRGPAGAAASAAAIMYVFHIIVPVVVYVLLRLGGLREVGFVDVVATIGYAATPLVTTAAIVFIPNDVARWALSVGAGLWAATSALRTLVPSLMSGVAKPFALAVFALVLVAEVALAAAMRFVFIIDQFLPDKDSKTPVP